MTTSDGALFCSLVQFSYLTGRLASHFCNACESMENRQNARALQALTLADPASFS